MIKKLLASSFRSLFMLIVCVTLIPSLLIIVLSGVEYGRSLEENVRVEALRQIETLALVQNTITESVRQTLTTLAVLPAFAEGDIDRQSVILRDVLLRNPDFVNISSTDTKGIVVSSAKLDSGTDLSMRKHITEALSGKDFAAGEFIIARVGDEPAFPYSICLRNASGEITGTINTVYKLSSYVKAFDQLRLPSDAILGITDHAGTRIFFHPAKETNPVGSPIKGLVWEAMVEGSDSGTIVQSGSDGIKRFYAYRKLRLPEDTRPYLYLVLGIPEESALAPARRILTRNLILMGLVVVLSVLVSAVLGYLLLGSKLRKLAETVGRIEGGEFSARTGMDRAPAEIVRVAGAIDTMAAALENRSRERDEAERGLSDALREKETLLREIHHRVKNNMQLILSMISLEKGNSDDVEAFALQIETKIRAMASVHEMMYQSESLADIEMESFLARLAELNEGSCASFTVRVRADSCRLRLEKAITLSLIVNELLVNCAKYGRSADGTVEAEVRFSVENGSAALTVRDRGRGFPEGFSVASHASLGMKLTETLTAQLGGTMALDNVRGREPGGAVVRITFPL